MSDLFGVLKPSPGPWKQAGNEVNYWPIVDSNGLLVANVWREMEQGKCNARLVAAAPKLLSACQNAEKTFRNYAELHRAKGTLDGNRKTDANEKLADEMRAAIVEAKGDSP